MTRADASPPRVTIGMPVYNGEARLATALDSLLAQDYRDFELIISDNASTDATGSICHDYARADGRIRYYRHPQNMGAAHNFQRVLQLARGQYFMWAAYDDLWDPDFLTRCLAVLETDPSAVLAYPQT